MEADQYGSRESGILPILCSEVSLMLVLVNLHATQATWLVLCAAAAEFKVLPSCI